MVAASARIMDNLMLPNKWWNRLGPKLPAWFRTRLKRIDPNLVLQFLPPDTADVGSRLNGNLFPYGVWAVCRRMRGSPFLFKRWVWSLNNERGMYEPPGRDTIALLKRAHGMWRNGCLDQLEVEFVKVADAARREKVAESRGKLLEGMAACCKAMDFVVPNRVCMRGNAIPSGV